MTGADGLQLALYFVVLFALAQPLGTYIARVYEGTAPLLERPLGPLERGFYRLAGVDRNASMSWQQYAIALLVFNFAGFLVVYGLQRFQGFLPLNPQGLPAPSPDLSFNTAVSFVTNT